MNTVQITEANFDELVINADKKVLLDFWASWCGPCQMVSPLVEEIADEHPEFFIGKVNVDEEPRLARDFNIDSIPSLVVLENGEEVTRAIGARSKQAILDLLKP